jgi:hypothetical protein
MRRVVLLRLKSPQQMNLTTLMKKSLQLVNIFPFIILCKWGLGEIFHSSALALCGVFQERNHCVECAYSLPAHQII